MSKVNEHTVRMDVLRNVGDALSHLGFWARALERNRVEPSGALADLQRSVGILTACASKLLPMVCEASSRLDLAQSAFDSQRCVDMAGAVLKQLADIQEEATEALATGVVDEYGFHELGYRSVIDASLSVLCAAIECSTMLSERAREEADGAKL